MAIRKFFNKDNIIQSIILFIFVISYILFIVFIKTNAIVAYVCGIIIFLCLFASFISPLISKDRITVFGWIEMSVNFVATVILLSAYIAAIENDNLRNTLIPIAASSIGGLLTLFGVAITIKYNRITNEENYLKKIKPYIFIVSDVTWSSLPKDKKEHTVINVDESKSDIKKAKSNCKTNLYNFDYIFIGCSDISMCTFYGIEINNSYLIKFDFEKVILKNSYVLIQIDYPFSFKGKINKINFILEDMLQNQYVSTMRYSIEKNGNANKIKFESIYDIHRY